MPSPPYSLGACSLDLQNPNSPTEAQVTTSVDGVIALATGLQGRFATSYFNYRLHGRARDRRVRVDDRRAHLDQRCRAGCGAVRAPAIAENVFNSIYRTVRTADDLLTGSDALASQFDPGTRSGLRALAFALKAEALGEALQSYQRIPIKTFGVDGPDVRGARRGAAATSARCSTPPPRRSLRRAPSAFFNNSILTPGVNLPNVIQLFRARYARMANDDADGARGGEPGRAQRTGGAVGAHLPGADGQLRTRTSRAARTASRRVASGDCRCCRRISASRTSSRRRRRRLVASARCSIRGAVTPVRRRRCPCTSPTKRC